MDSMKSIKSRIKSVENTRQITKAMELVATSKMRHAKERIERTKPYFDILRDTLDNISSSNNDFSSPFTVQKDGKCCFIVIAGDRGLAGGYNNNLFKSVNANEDDIIFPIGKKAVEHFKNYELLSTDYSVTENVDISDCHDIGKILAKAFLEGKFTSLKIFYTGFINVLTQKPSSEDILPIISRKKTDFKKLDQIIYEPSSESVFEHIIPQYIAGVIYGGVCHSLASELSARRNAMQSATENADEMIESLNLKFNRARQASITQEITEIVAGAEN